MLRNVVVVAATRTAIARFQGAFAQIPAVELGASVIRALFEATKIDPGLVGHVLMGQVLTAAAGQNPARQAAVKAGVPYTTPAMTINRVCGSVSRQCISRRGRSHAATPMSPSAAAWRT